MVLVAVAMMISLCFSGPFDRMAKSAPTCGREFHHQCWRDPWQHLAARVMHVMGGLCRILSLCHVFSNQPTNSWPAYCILLPFTATALHFVRVCVCVRSHLGCLITIYWAAMQLCLLRWSKLGFSEFGLPHVHFPSIARVMSRWSNGRDTAGHGCGMGEWGQCHNLLRIFRLAWRCPVESLLG